MGGEQHDDLLEDATIPQTTVAMPVGPAVAKREPGGTPPGVKVSTAGPPAVVAALHAEEAARMRGWSMAVIVLASFALGFTPSLAGSVARKIPFVVALGAVAATAAWVRWRCHDDRRYTPRVFRVFGWVAATASFELVYFLGVFSPTPVVITLGVTFIGLGLDRRYALVIPLYAITGYAGLAGLITAGVIEDHGVIRATELTLAAKLFGAIMVPSVLLMTLGLARLSRHTMAEAARRSHEALRLAKEREAQLAEANQNLEDALRAGAGQQGRWTGQSAGAWELADVVGRGAMGEVYAAHNRSTGEAAAVKLLRADAAQNDKLLERFNREGEITSRLHVANIVRVHETGRIAGRVPYIAMELLTGEDLARILRRSRVLDHDTLVELAVQIGRGLDAAHAAGIVHRDLKPQNIFRATTGDPQATWKILDFGVSTLIGSSGTLTQAAVVGTPGYMAPEQARSQSVDHRCDVFALGAVLYRAVTGRPAFTGTDTPQILFDVVYRMPHRPSELVDALPPGIDSVLAIALAKVAEERFASAGELAAALAAAIAGPPDRSLRQRADALIAKHPWGRSLSS